MINIKTLTDDLNGKNRHIMPHAYNASRDISLLAVGDYFILGNNKVVLYHIDADQYIFNDYSFSYDQVLELRKYLPTENFSIQALRKWHFYENEKQRFLNEHGEVLVSIVPLYKLIWYSNMWRDSHIDNVTENKIDKYRVDGTGETETFATKEEAIKYAESYLNTLTNK